MHPRHEALVARFLEVAKVDDRLAAVALVGSNSTGTADDHSDLDLILVTYDTAFDEFIAGRDSFLASVGEPLFVESWSRVERWFFVFADGGDGELTVIRADAVHRAFDAQFVTLLDKRGILQSVQPSPPSSRLAGPQELLDIQRRLTGFWHDYAHFVTAWSRGQWWWANGQLEVLRGMCANLLRINANPTDPEVGEEPYWKVELTLPVAELARLAPTLNTLEPDSMLASARALASLHREVGQRIAQRHSLAYPEALESIVLARLDGPPDARGSTH